MSIFFTKNFLDHLIAAYKASGDLKVLVRIYEKYKLQLFRMCMFYLKNASESEDACTDIFIILKEKLLSHEVKNFESWLYVISKNHCLKKLKSKSRNLIAEINFHEKVKNEESEDPLDEAIRNLPEAIDQLKEEQRWCLILFFLHGKSYKEIESIKGYDFNKIKSSIQHGKKNLKNILEKHVIKSF